MKKINNTWLTAPLLSLSILAAACDDRLSIVRYVLPTKKLQAPVRLVLLSDLHSCCYGEEQKELLDAIAKQSPDLIVMTGDMTDDRVDPENTVKLIKAIGPLYPCYYVSGNHEYGSGRMDEIKKLFRESGIIILEGSTDEIKVNGQCIALSGIDDPYNGLSKTLEQLKSCGLKLQPDKYNILMAHRPEMIDTYLKNDYDLIVCGHAHGGQWRLPGLINGLYAPGQGLFPKYAGGHYPLKKAHFIVSRGLARESTKIPRIFNRPEIVVIELQSLSSS